MKLHDNYVSSLRFKPNMAKSKLKALVIDSDHELQVELSGYINEIFSTKFLSDPKAAKAIIRYGMACEYDFIFINTDTMLGDAYVIASLLRANNFQGTLVAYHRNTLSDFTKSQIEATCDFRLLTDDLFKLSFEPTLAVA